VCERHADERFGSGFVEAGLERAPRDARSMSTGTAPIRIKAYISTKNATPGRTITAVRVPRANPDPAEPTRGLGGVLLQLAVAQRR
jgi:hypothetical protein